MARRTVFVTRSPRLTLPSWVLVNQVIRVIDGGWGMGVRTGMSPGCSGSVEHPQTQMSIDINEEPSWSGGCSPVRQAGAEKSARLGPSKRCAGWMGEFSSSSLPWSPHRRYRQVNERPPAPSKTSGRETGLGQALGIGAGRSTVGKMSVPTVTHANYDARTMVRTSGPGEHVVV